MDIGVCVSESLISPYPGHEAPAWVTPKERIVPLSWVGSQPRNACLAADLFHQPSTSSWCLMSPQVTWHPHPALSWQPHG